MTNTQPLSNLLFIGEKENITLPDGKEIEIRENNGEDESILSRFKDAMEGTSINNYISSIVTQSLSGDNKGSKFTPKEILNWKVNCKSFVLMKARILSLGDIFKFSFTCGNPKCNHNAILEEDLNPFVKPYSEDNIQGIKPYPLGEEKTHEFIVPSSNRKVKFDILDGVAEKASLDTPREGINKNHGLFIRNLHILHEGAWEKVFQFAMFSSKELVQIRAEVSRVDPEYDPASLITCPKCNQSTVVSMLGEPTFFYPTEI